MSSQHIFHAVSTFVWTAIAVNRRVSIILSIQLNQTISLTDQVTLCATEFVFWLKINK